MTNFDTLVQRIIAFRDSRDWEQFHNPKDVAISLCLESSELLEHFQWKGEDEIRDYVVAQKEALGGELADVLYWVLLLSHDLGIDLADAFEKKMEVNETKYPVSKAKGRKDKYTEL